MASPVKGKPASALGGDPASEIEQLGGELVSNNMLDALRAQYLSEIFSLPPDTASLLAELAFAAGAPR